MIEMCAGGNALSRRSRSSGGGKVGSARDRRFLTAFQEELWKKKSAIGVNRSVPSGDTC